MVTDFAPLYHDGVASAASKKLIRKHLKECAECAAYYKKYTPAENVKIEMPVSEAEDFVQLARRMRKRRLLLWAGFLSYVSVTIATLALFWAEKNKKI
ncbi:MAG: zf-HC2 domain-containing protein [Bacillota bacterium]|nr:zf-HC2 domain-containing protein [Bacillota bacterium]